MDKEEIKNLLLDFIVEYDPTSWSNEKVYDKFAEIFYQKITDLEAKLAENEKAIKYLKGIKRYDIGEMLTENAKLKQQLAEWQDGTIIVKWTDAENKVKELEQQLAEKDQAIESLQEINQSLGQTCNNDAKEIERLREQIAEKEKEIEELNKFMSDKADEIEDLKERISDKITSAYGAELMAKDVQWHLEKEIQELKQSQNQTAIAELNNILDTFAIFVNEEKESMVSPDGNGNLSLLEYIENRIDTLKGEK